MSPPRDRPLYKRVRRAFKRILARTVAALAPLAYVAYMALVWRTSRVELHDAERIRARANEGRGFVALLWHEEVVAAPYVYAKLGIRARVLIGQGGPGDVATAIAERMGHVVTRGGSSRRASRRRPAALRTLIRELQEDPSGIVAVLVDGPSGPRYHVKPGALLVARAAGLPLVLVRVWFRRCWRLSTWDRVGVPLPWNVIRVYTGAPVEVPGEASDREGLERFRAGLQQDLLALSARSYREAGQPLPDRLVALQAFAGRAEHAAGT